jgi:hypothetical protein
MTLVKAEVPPEDRLNQVRNYSQILHHCYLSLNVEGIIPEIY